MIRKVSPVQTKGGAEQYERELRKQLVSGEILKGGAKRQKVQSLKEFSGEFLAYQAAMKTQAKLAPQTINHQLKLIARMLRVAKRWKLIRDVPEVVLASPGPDGPRARCPGSPSGGPPGRPRIPGRRPPGRVWRRHRDVARILGEADHSPPPPPPPLFRPTGRPAATADRHTLAPPACRMPLVIGPCGPPSPRSSGRAWRRAIQIGGHHSSAQRLARHLDRLQC